MRATVFLLLVLAVVGCVSDPLAEAGVACDPMVYASKFSGSGEDIWTISEGEASTMTESGNVDVNPAISRDGLRIAFTSGPGDQENLDLVLMSADTANRLYYALRSVVVDHVPRPIGEHYSSPARPSCELFL